MSDNIELKNGNVVQINKAIDNIRRNRNNVKISVKLSDVIMDTEREGHIMLSTNSSKCQINFVINEDGTVTKTDIVQI